MNNELDYVEQMKLKTMKVLSTQLQSFSKIQEERWKKRKEAEKQYQKEKLLDIQKEFILREKKRQAQFDSYMLNLEEKMGMALNMIDKEKEEKLRRNMNAQIGNKELQDIFGVGEDFHDKKYQDQLEILAGGYNDLERKDLENLKRRSIISKNSQQLRKSKNNSKKSKSRRGSTSTINTLKTKIRDDESDPDSIFIYVKAITNLPENCTLTMIVSALLDDSGDIIYDLGQKVADLNSDSLNPRFDAKYKIPINLLEKGNIYLYSEIKTLDDAISSLPASIFGSVVLPITSENISIKAPIFFETYNELIVEEFKKELEIYIGPYLALTIGKGKVNQSTRFKDHELVKNDYQKKARKYLKKRESEVLGNKLDVIVRDRDFVEKEELESLLKEDDGNINWVAHRYFVPLSKLKTTVNIKVIGVISVDSEEKDEVIFLRSFKNPDSDGVRRKSRVFNKLDWNSCQKFQIFDENELVFDYKDIGTTSTVVFEIFSSTIENGELKLKDIGMSAVPLMDNLENPTFGIFVIPVFDQTINKNSLDFFGQKNGLEMLERMYTDENVFVSNKFLVLRISDGYRLVRFNI